MSTKSPEIKALEEAAGHYNRKVGTLRAQLAAAQETVRDRFVILHRAQCAHEDAEHRAEILLKQLRDAEGEAAATTQSLEAQRLYDAKKRLVTERS